MTNRILHFQNDKAKYLLLNIIAHDVIHDYGPAGGTEKRWSDNQTIVSQFTQDYYSFNNVSVGGDKRSRVETITDEDYNSSKIQNTNNYTPSIYQYGKQINLPQQNVNFQQPFNLGTQPFFHPGSNIAKGPKKFPGQAMTIGQQPIQDPIETFTINYENYIGVLNEMKTDINNSIIFTFFNHFLIGINSGIINDTTINFLDTYALIVPYGTDDNSEIMADNNYIDIFKDIANKFIGYCYIKGISQNLFYADFLNILCEFLSITYSTEQSIFENIVEPQLVGGSNGKKNKKKHMKGGKGDIQLNADEAQQLINAINSLTQSSEITSELNELNRIYNQYNESKGFISQQDKQNYDTTRKNVLKRYQDIFLSQQYDQKKKAGIIYGDIDILPIIKARFSYRTVDLIPNFVGRINNMLLEYHKVIAEAQREQELIERKKLEDELAAQQGNLTSADKAVRQQFSSFIAKGGLFLSGICDKNGIISGKLNATNMDESLKKEINILLYIADWTSNVGWQEVRNQSLDDELIDHFNQIISPIEGTRYICKGANIMNYVVNNAAPISSDLKNKSFCPYTSILDGMSQCSWNSAQGNIEYGNMNFTIADAQESIYYNGIMNIINPTNISLSFNVKASNISSLNITLSGNLTTTMNGLDLQAHFVLKNTLVNVINFIINPSNEQIRSSIFSGGNIFGNLFNLFSSVPQNYELFNTVYSAILFKGTGDLFQEINCVCKFGGYTMQNYKINSGILPINTSSGEQLRFFAANDRPSGTRFIYMLKNGNPNEINKKAMGGYYSKEHILIFKRSDNDNNCSIVPFTKGGRIKRKTIKHKGRKVSNKKKIKFTRKNYKI